MKKITAADVVAIAKNRHRAIVNKLESQGWVKDAIQWHKAIGEERSLRLFIKYVERKYVHEMHDVY